MQQKTGPTGRPPFRTPEGAELYLKVGRKAAPIDV